VGKPKIVVLDRDGVINEDSDHYIKSPDEWIPLPGSIAAIAKLKEAGYLVAIATNQSGIGRGYFSEEVLSAMHQKLRDQLAEHTDLDIDLIVYCPHKPDEGCDCRKPNPGLLDQIESLLVVDLEGQYLVGDSLKDLQVASAKKMKPILVKTGKGAETLQRELPADVLIQEDLSSAVDHILRKQG
jgi:D-glycero-D-manno-heptose 1,7-bisphosphate phosphatase